MSNTGWYQAEEKLEESGTKQMKNYLQDIYTDVNCDKCFDRPCNRSAEKISVHQSYARRIAEQFQPYGIPTAEDNPLPMAIIISSDQFIIHDSSLPPVAGRINLRIFNESGEY